MSSSSRRPSSPEPARPRRKSEAAASGTCDSGSYPTTRNAVADRARDGVGEQAALAAAGSADDERGRDVILDGPGRDFAECGELADPADEEAHVPERTADRRETRFRARSGATAGDSGTIRADASRQHRC